MNLDDSVLRDLEKKGYTVVARPMTILKGKRTFGLTSRLDFDAADLLTTFRRNGLPVDDFTVEQQGHGIYQNYQIEVTVTT